MDGAAQAKILTMVILGTSSIFAGLLPSWCVAETQVQNSLFISSLLCAGSGILLATAMTHMLPEVQEQLPYHPEAIICLGFFLIYFIEELTCVLKHRPNHVQSSTPHYGSIPRQPPHNPDYVPSASDCILTNPEPVVCHITHSATTSHFSLLLALGIHATLEGLAIGVQTVASHIYLLGLAVASHKLVISFCLGTMLTVDDCRLRFSVLSGVTVFALSSVLGIGLGMALINSTWLAQIGYFTPILQALAVGTLLYVTFAEVMPNERQKFHSNGPSYAGIVQLFATIVGFGIMVAVSTLIGEPDHVTPTP